MFRRLAVALLTLAALACARPEAGPAGARGADGSNGRNGHAALVRSDVEPAGEHCSAGGVKLSFGVDDNDDGVLGDGEVAARNSQYLCNGPAGVDGKKGEDGPHGLSTLVRSDPELPGSHCTAGGVRLSFGLDVDASGTLEEAEITPAATKYVCHGENGAQGLKGDTGAAGRNALVSTASEGPGTTCPTGGIRVQAGLDANGDGVLGADEVNAQLTQHVCNGADGQRGLQGVSGINGRNGYTSLVVTSPEPAGSNCAAGGVKVTIGLDLDGNGALESVELAAAQIRYVCHGATGPAGTFSGSFSGPASFTGTVTMTSAPSIAGKDLFNAVMGGTSPAILAGAPTCTDGSTNGPPNTLTKYEYGEVVYTSDGDVSLDLGPTGTGSCANVCGRPLTYFFTLASTTTLSVTSYLDDNGAIYVNGSLYKKTGGSSGAAQVSLPSGPVALTFLACSNNGPTVALSTSGKFVSAGNLAVDLDRTFHRNGK